MKLLAVTLACLVGCRGGDTPRAEPHRKHDPHSQSEPDRIVVTHLALELTVDFAARTLAGTARLSLHKSDLNAKTVVLDTEDLAIASVIDCASKAKLDFQLGPPVKVLGRALTIEAGTSGCIEIAYQTSPTARALLWVDPSGTLGKQHPMLFTQSQAILARTWIPLQDTPGVRFTYDATIHVPPGQWALMSAENPQRVSRDGSYTFRMNQPIPSYLMALAVGDFAFQAIGKRTGVYAEPALVGAAAKEFVEVDAMMAAAEELYGPYRWDRYDMLVLPPSFPFGGMENPKLTFLTPTVIAGDRSLVDLIAHELAHSWSGNLVTNATWNDFWLNEGFTTYVERRIMAKLRGPDYDAIQWTLSEKELREALAKYKDTDPVTFLALHQTAADEPDDVPGTVAYEKGSLLLHAMELAFGRDKLDTFLRKRFDRLAFQSSDTETFEADANAELFGKKNVGWTLAPWLHAGGIPAGLPPQTSKIVAEVEALAARVALPPQGWTTAQWTIYLSAIPDTATPAQLAALDAVFHLTQGNAEILMHWLPHLIQANVRTAVPVIESYLSTVGRLRMVRPVYAALMAGDDAWKALARGVYAKAKDLYHPITREAIGALVK